uniref:Alba domain-containing protein n=1 Tax=Panagrellus redivivus TaxID=6233 RepID=A0A7E4UU44_PANRE
MLTEQVGQEENKPQPYTLNITTKSPFAYQIKKCTDILDLKTDVLRIVGRGNSIPRCLALVAEINNVYGTSVKIQAVTFSDTYGQDIDEFSYEEGAVSGVAFRVARVPLLVA